MTTIRHDFSTSEIQDIYSQPFFELLDQARAVHKASFPKQDIQFCTLLSVKTGNCPEDCAYCPQSARYHTGIDKHGLLDRQTILDAAAQAKESGSTRFCMGAAWRNPPRKGPQFDALCSVIREVSDMGLEVCTTLGMLDSEQATKLKEAGVYAYNHNLDSSREFYQKIITTRTYDDRLETLRNVRQAGMTVCCGGIIGMGEDREDRWELLRELSALDPHPESVPINLLVKVEGTPLSDISPEEVDAFELARMIATARILMPKSRVRLSAGRTQLNDEGHALCYYAGANSIFAGEKLLTTENPEVDFDATLTQKLDLPITQKATTASI